jgi:hypothetical protein
MAKQGLIKEFHISVFIPAGLPEPAVRRFRRTLQGTLFRTALGRAIREVFQQRPSLSPVHVTLGR